MVNEDLVKRLNGAYSTVFERSLAREAAVEIEQLRAKLSTPVSAQTISLPLPSGAVANFIVSDPGSPVWDELRGLVERVAALEAEKQYTCPNHAGEVRRGGECVWCERDALRADIERHVAICAEQATAIENLHAVCSEYEQRLQIAEPALRTAQTEIEGLQANCTVLIQMMELMSEIPNMSDAQLQQLVANARTAIDAARAGSKSCT